MISRKKRILQAVNYQQPNNRMGQNRSQPSDIVRWVLPPPGKMRNGRNLVSIVPATTARIVTTLCTVVILQPPFFLSNFLFLSYKKT